MQTLEKDTAIKPEVLTGNYLTATINRTNAQFKKGYLSKCHVSKLLGRSRNTLHTWDQLL